MADNFLDAYEKAPKALRPIYEEGIHNVFRRSYAKLLQEEENPVVHDAAVSHLHQSDTVTDLARFRG